MGIWLDRPLYDEETKALALQVIDRLRPTVYLPSDSLAGMRFFNTPRVFELLESETRQAEFLHYPIRSVEKALIEAAQSDYFYEYEKEYDYEPLYESESEMFED